MKYLESLESDVDATAKIEALNEGHAVVYCEPEFECYSVEFGDHTCESYDRETAEHIARMLENEEELHETFKLVEKYLVDRNIGIIGIVGRTEVLPAIRTALAKLEVKA